ncbi:zonular occludens toxin domain-containing protein [Polaromonas sp. YR568]|uniref:zonular occludens toxin family protein n=1 Tax=Polaromonas sp. YR568 TaxID=1855301 RepID=UPI0031380DD3
MAINAYTGLMGSGKSYEVVENVILPALIAGRRVVTNVSNLQVAEITAYLVKSGADASKIGTIVQIKHEDVTKPFFFPPEDGKGLPADVLPVVQGGDLVVIDECWRFWPSGGKMPLAHMEFFRMHRHFMNPETSVTCDIVLVVQDIGDLDRKLKAVVENTYVMTKLKALGLTTRYRVDIYARVKVRNPYRSLQRKYNKEIFELYRSYSQGGGQSGNEVAIDDRANMLKGAMFTIGLPLMLLFFGFSVWGLWRFFHPPPPKPSPGAAVTAPGLPGAAPPRAEPGESDWRVVGHYSFGPDHYVIITRGQAVRTLMNPRGFYYDALRAYGSLDGKLLANYTGSPDATTLLPDARK